MNSFARTVFIVSFAGMFFAFVFDLMNLFTKSVSRLFFSVFLAIFLVNWFVALILLKKR